MNFAEKLRRMGACGEAIAWVGERTLEQAWAECKNPHWMLWLASRATVDARETVLCGCEIARTVLHLVPGGEARPRVAIETAEAWCRGEATAEQVYSAARAAAYAAAARADADAAYAAARAAAYAAYAAARAAAVVADAAHAAYADAKAASLVRSAEMVRARITADTIGAGLEVKSCVS